MKVFFLLSLLVSSVAFAQDIIPNDPLFLQKQWGLINLGQGDSSNMQGYPGLDGGLAPVWKQSTGSRKVIVAVIDYAVDETHPDLKNNMWTNEAELHGRAGVDDDNNGYVDDIHGFDFCHHKASTNTTAEPYHATFVAGIIGAEGNNNVGLSGVNWQVSIMSLKFFGGDGCGMDDQAIEAIHYAVKNGARVINASWGGPEDNKKLYRAIEYARDNNVLFVTTAGNDGKGRDGKYAKHYPGDYKLENIINVAAANSKGELWQSEGWGSNYGPESVHLAAPGVDVWSTSPGGLYDTHSGTSFAAPYVSGVAALLLSIHPEWSYQTLRSRILNNVTPMPALKGKVQTGGMVNAYAALTNQKPADFILDIANWASRPISISTAHPIEGRDMHFKVQEPGAKMIAVHFNRFDLGTSRVLIQNSVGARVEYITGNRDRSFSLAVAGDKADILLLPDGKNPSYGFDIDQISFVK